jgi:large subunit ribosomal protein L10
MPRPDKVQAVQDIKERFEESQAVFLTEFRGMTVKQLQQLRRVLRDTGADYKVVKMTLARRATDELGLDGISDHLVGPTALAFAKVDPVATAKALRDFGRESDRLVVKAGVLAGSVLEGEAVSRLADIEPREVLLAKIAGAAKAPLYQMAGMLQAFTRNAASMFSQLLEKKEAGQPTAEPAEVAAPVAAEEPAATTEAPEPAEDQPAVEEPTGSDAAADQTTDETPEAPAAEADEAEQAEEE